MNDIDKAINEIYDFIKELRAENQKQNKILYLLKNLIEIIPNNTTFTNNFLNIRIKPLHSISDKDLLEIKEWLDNE